MRFRMTIAAAVLGAFGLASMPQPAAAGGISPGAAVGIGLGAFALGTAVGAAPYYYGPYAYYPPPPPAYYPAYPAPAYYAPPRSCWNPYYRQYYAC